MNVRQDRTGTHGVGEARPLKPRGYRSAWARVDNPLPRLTAIKIADWPQNDREVYLAALETGDLLGDPGGAATWRLKTRVNRSAVYGRFLGCLALNSHLVERDTLIERVTTRNVDTFLAHLNATVSPMSARQAILEVSFFLAAVRPDIDWRWVRKRPALPSERQALASRKVKPFIEAADIIAPALARLSVLNELPTMRPDEAYEVMELALVVVGFFTKLRLSNLVGLTLGESIFPGASPVRISITEQHSKTAVLIETILSPRADWALRLYLNRARPVLLAERPDAGLLWLHSRGIGVRDRTAWAIFSRLGQRFLGRHVTPHTARYSYATTMQMAAPGSMGLTAAGLAHRGVATMMHHYDQSGTAAAGARWEKIVKSFKSER